MVNEGFNRRERSRYGQRRLRQSGASGLHRHAGRRGRNPHASHPLQDEHCSPLTRLTSAVVSARTSYKRAPNELTAGGIRGGRQQASAHKSYLGCPGMDVLYLCTFGLLWVGIIWDLFTLPGQVQRANDLLMSVVLRNRDPDLIHSSVPIPVLGVSREQAS
jgi:hypothetical protein